MMANERFKIYKTQEYSVKTQDKDIMIKNEDRWEKIELKGININAVKPGVFPGEKDVSEEEYLNWFNYIYEMNVNCLRVPYLMPNKFYKALETFNKEHEKVLYLLQGIGINEVDLKDGYDIQGKKLQEDFEVSIKNTINAVHGNVFKRIPKDISEVYKTDISEYVIGYTLGIEWASKDIIFSEIMNDETSYQGKYFTTSKEASTTEAYLAKMADYLADYEGKYYGEQRLITVVGTAYELLEKLYEPDNSRYNKHYIDVENIKPTREFKSGIFVSYNLYPSLTSLREYQGDIGWVTKNINDYHKIPVVISEYGIPSARLAGDYVLEKDKAYVTEKEQGEALAHMYSNIKETKCAGSFMYNWQDEWSASAWNTKDKVILDKSAYWSNAQTYSQSYGLLAFEPGEKGTTIYPDDSKEDWNNEKVLSENENFSLSVKSDEKYMYFLVNSKNGIDIYNREFFIDLDVTPKSGTKISSEYGLEFENPVDFLIHINGRDNSKLLVQEYYDTFEFYDNEKKIRLRPDRVENYEKDVDRFLEVMEYTTPKMHMKFQDQQLEKKAYPTGKLTYGNGNPDSEDYNSAADFYINKDHIEIRIPWGLLNFMDPTSRKIHDDYFETFKAKALDISNISVGLTLKWDNEEKIRVPSAKYHLEEWIKPKYHERLKESYYILKETLKN